MTCSREARYIKAQMPQNKKIKARAIISRLSVVLFLVIGIFINKPNNPPKARLDIDDNRHDDGTEVCLTA